MLFNLIQIQRGKETIMMTDSRKLVNARMKELRVSHRTKNIKYVMREADTNVKYEKPPHDGSYVGGDYPTTPARVRK
jgi:hypothetical protein